MPLRAILDVRACVGVLGVDKQPRRALRHCVAEAFRCARQESFSGKHARALRRAVCALIEHAKKATHVVTQWAESNYPFGGVWEVGQCRETASMFSAMHASSTRQVKVRSRETS